MCILACIILHLDHTQQAESIHLGTEMMINVTDGTIYYIHCYYNPSPNWVDTIANRSQFHYGQDKAQLLNWEYNICVIL